MMCQMKKCVLLLFVASMYSAMASQACAQETATSKGNPVVESVRLKSLQAKRDSLQQAIRVEDAKRNAQINGVTPERQEELNNRQDSICLDLRSQLVEVTLEIKEMAPDVATPQFMQQYNQLLGKKRKTDKE